MDVFKYLDIYQSIPLDQAPFNEVDAMVFSSLAYPKYEEFLDERKEYNAQEILYLLTRYDETALMKRKRQYIELLHRVCASRRFGDLKLVHFVSHHDIDISKQFQAVSFVINKMVVICFCGTDGTTVGLKEDIDMSYLDFTPAELEAIEYLKLVAKSYPKKDIYITGHSKGGRLAISSAKHFEDKKRIKGIYSMDGPNYQPSFYDEEYKKIDKVIYRFVPEESIIGRLISEPKNYRIVKSKNSLLMQHDTSSWEIIDNHFCYLANFSKRSTRIVNALNGVNEKYDIETKKEFSDTLFDIVTRLDITAFSDKNTNLAILKESITKLPSEWKKTPKEERKVLKSILLSTFVDYMKER